MLTLEVDRGAASAANIPPKRAPDAVVEERTQSSQAALYRLSGDANPLHVSTGTVTPVDTYPVLRFNPSLRPSEGSIDLFCESVSAIMNRGLILQRHGLAFFGFAGKHILKTYGEFKDIKARFTGSVYPGETLVTEMWKEGDKVIFGK